VRIALSLALLLAATSSSFADPSPRVRGASPKEVRIIEDLLDRSAIARALVSELEGSDVIVYVQLAPDAAGGRAATQFVTSTGRDRFLRIAIGAMTPPFDRGALLAHELQHAVEIAREPDVRDDEGMRRLYLRIGEDRAARTTFETTAAREIGFRVRQELTAGRRPDAPVQPAVATSMVARGEADHALPAPGAAARAPGSANCGRID
jgi:hypothetical protein